MARPDIRDQASKNPDHQPPATELTWHDERFTDRGQKRGSRFRPHARPTREGIHYFP
jgi:hypothetical protein